ncbi:alpha/beta hydrolase [Pigmentiphaga soli]|uniref:Alpha/beta hydrolase n=1 Tax=Pigmentiphaga soli TaxID=1007095 RepID=A0ABP8HCS3_9BURK
MSDLVYRGMSREQLDRAYNNRAAVADSHAIMEGWTQRSQAVQAPAGVDLDLPYGPRPRERIDLYLAGAGAPVLLFLHGGYWQMNRREDFRFVAEGPLAHGISVAIGGYTLAPELDLPGMVEEVRQMVAWLRARLGGRILLAGWSAGAHLAASAMDHPDVAGGLAISGIYDLEPIRHSYLNAKLGLDRAAAAQASPLWHLPARSGPLDVAFGELELPELARQSADYWQAWRGAGLRGELAALGGHNHFTILDELAAPQGRLARMVAGRA